MSNCYVVPEEKSVSSLLSSLLGAETKISDGEKVDFDQGYVANYISPEDQTVAVCVADKFFAANAGASLMLVPAGSAKEAAEKNDLTNVMLEAFYEVCNILSRAMMDSKSSHLRLSTLSKPGDDIGFLSALDEGVKEVSFSVAVSGYGEGNVTFRLKAQS